MMNNGFFWKVPGKEGHFLYSDLFRGLFAEADFKGHSSNEMALRLDKLPLKDKLTLMLISQKAPDENENE